MLAHADEFAIGGAVDNLELFRMKLGVGPELQFN